MENENRNPEIENEMENKTDELAAEEATEAEEINAEEAPSEEKPAEEPIPLKKRVLKEIREWVVSIAVALLVVFVLKSFVFTIIRVDGGSMKPTLVNDQRLFVTVADVKLFGAERGDIVICHYPGRTTEILGIETKTNFVKRVVAVEGDTVFRKDNATYVTYGDTGETVDLDSQWAARYPGYDYEYTLGEDEYFVVGDNRGNSHDSRDWNDWVPNRDVGPITGDMLVGKVRFVIWPFSDIGAVE